MKIKLDFSKMPCNQQEAVFSALFQMAFSDHNLHPNEIMMLSEAIDKINKESLGEGVNLDGLMKHPLPFDDCLDTIKEGVGDIPGIVFILLMDMALADEQVVGPEIMLLNDAFLSLEIEKCNVVVLKEIHCRLRNFQSTGIRAQQLYREWVQSHLDKTAKIIGESSDACNVGPEQSNLPRIPHNNGLPAEQSQPAPGGGDGCDLLSQLLGVLEQQGLRNLMNDLACDDK